MKSVLQVVVNPSPNVTATTITIQHQHDNNNKHVVCSCPDHFRNRSINLLQRRWNGFFNLKS